MTFTHMNASFAASQATYGNTQSALFDIPSPVAKPTRTREPIRRGSHLAGRCEAMLWKPQKRRDLRKIVLAAKRYERESRQPGKRVGALGSVAIEIIDYLANLTDAKTGRLEPSISYLMERLKRSRDAIVRGLQALRRHGFLEWVRRYVPSGNEGAGPRLHQTSNAYRMLMPAKGPDMLGQYAKETPVPDDQLAYMQEINDQLNVWLEQLPYEEKMTFHVEDQGLSDVLKRMALSIKKRESAKQSESISKD